MKRFLSIIPFVIIVASLSVYLIGVSNIRSFVWHLFNNETVVYQNMQIKLSKDWWPFFKQNDNMILFNSRKANKTIINLSFSRKNYEMTNSNIPVMVSNVCTDGYKNPNIIIIDKEEALEFQCKSATSLEPNKDVIWIIPSQRFVILSDSNIGKEYYYSLFNNIKWLKN